MTESPGYSPCCTLLLLTVRLQTKFIDNYRELESWTGTPCRCHDYCPETDERPTTYSRLAFHVMSLQSASNGLY